MGRFSDAFSYVTITNTMKNTTIISGLIALQIAFSPALALAQFNAGFIISDQELFAANTMNAESIQDFLDSQPGVLKNHVDIDIDGLIKTSAMIIDAAAKRHQINPQILLVKLQKEMGLITDTTPKQSQFDWAMGYGVCDDCDVTHPSVIKYKGFAKQIDNAAEFMAYVPVNQEKFYFKAGESYTISGEDVYIQNGVTSALYNYTPHIHGNEIFSALWEKWFGTTVYHPNGSILQAIGDPGVWYIRDGVRYPFTSMSALSSRFSVDQIVQVPQRLLEQYPIGAPISHPQYSLLETETGNIYLLVGTEKRLIKDDFVFRQLGYTQDEIFYVTEAEVAFYASGLPITEESLNPIGALIQDPRTNGVFFVQDGIKRPLIAPELLSLNYPGMLVRKGTVEEIDRYLSSYPVFLKDGLLVKSSEDPAVYVISGGQKLAIDSEYTFLTLGYKWESVHTVTQALLDIHPLGEPVSIKIEATPEVDQMSLHNE